MYYKRVCTVHDARLGNSQLTFACIQIVMNRRPAICQERIQIAGLSLRLNFTWVIIAHRDTYALALHMDETALLTEWDLTR